MMTIVVNAEEKFGVRIPDDEVKNLKTVGDAVSFIAKARPEPSPSAPGPVHCRAGRRRGHCDRPGTHPRPFPQGADQDP